MEKLTLTNNGHLVPVANFGRDGLALQTVVVPLVESVASTFLISHTKHIIILSS